MKWRAALFLLAAVMLPAVGSAQGELAPDEALPPGFRGEITYDGTYSGEIVTRAQRIRGPSLGEVVRSLASSQTLPLLGDYTITIRFEGRMVSGSARFRNRAGVDGAVLPPDSFTGTREGSDCTIQWSEGPPSIARCSPAEFALNRDPFENRDGDTMMLAATASQSRTVNYRQQELDRVAARVQQIASLDSRVEALRESYKGDRLQPAYICYRMRSEVGLHDVQLTDLGWLAADLAGIGADVRSSGDAEALAALETMSPTRIEALAAAARDGRAAAEANYEAACP